MTFSLADISGINSRIFRFYRGHVSVTGQGLALFPDTNLTFWWIHKGSVSVRTGEDSPVIAQQNDIFVCMPGVPRYQTFSDNAVISSVWLNVQWGKFPFCRFKGLPEVLDADNCPQLTSACREIETVLNTYDVHTIGTIDDYAMSLPDGLKLRALGMSVFSSLVNYLMAQGITLVSNQHSDSRVANAVRHLKSNNFSGAVPYEKLFECTGLSRVHLDRLFRQQLKVTPKQFIKRQCFERASELLTTSDKPVNEIAEILNFRSAAHFCSWFRRQTDLSPRQFRKQQLV